MKTDSNTGTFVAKVVRNQMQLDAGMKYLAQAMATFFFMGARTKGLDHKPELFHETINLMGQQTTKCALFIKNYTSRGFLSMSQPQFSSHR